MARSVEQSHAGFGDALRTEVVRVDLGSGAVHVLDADADADGRRQTRDVDVVRLLVHGLHLLCRGQDQSVSYLAYKCSL